MTPFTHRGYDHIGLITERTASPSHGRRSPQGSVMRSATVQTLETGSPPAFIAPMLASLCRQAPRGDEWAFEFKWDGIRSIARWDDEALTLFSRRGGDITRRYPELHEAAAEVLRDRSAVIDGEIIALDAEARPNFHRLQRRMHVTDPARARQLSRQVPTLFMAFDVLWLDGSATTALPYLERRALLAELELVGEFWQAPPHMIASGGPMIGAATELGLEGILAKRTDSEYLPGVRSDAWRKIRLSLRQEFVIGGWTHGKGARQNAFGALLVGYHDENGRLRYAGLVGTGFDQQEQRRLLSALRPRVRDSSPFADDVLRRDVTFVEPELVAEVRFSNWTPDHVLRHAVYLGERTDKPPAEVVRET